MVEVFEKIKASAEARVNTSVPSIPTNNRLIVLPEDEEEIE